MNAAAAPAPVPMVETIELVRIRAVMEDAAANQGPEGRRVMQPAAALLDLAGDLDTDLEDTREPEDQPCDADDCFFEVEWALKHTKDPQKAIDKAREFLDQAEAFLKVQARREYMQDLFGSGR